MVSVEWLLVRSRSDGPNLVFLPQWSTGHHGQWD